MSRPETAPQVLDHARAILELWRSWPFAGTRGTLEIHGLGTVTLQLEEPVR